MQTFSVQDVERVLRLSRGTIRGLVQVGFVKPSRGARREYRFSFQDLIVLRAARALIDAKVPRRRIRRALDDLRRHLPEEVPLSGLSISAVGEQVVVREGHNHFQVHDGQYLLGLDVEVDHGELRVVEHKAKAAAEGWSAPAPAEGRGAPVPAERQSTPATRSATAEAQSVQAAPTENWFAQALELEASDPAAALAAYEQATKDDPEDVSAWTNWGRLLHEQGRMAEAERVYRRAQEHCEPDAVLMFNFGVLLEDLGRAGPALEAYMLAIAHDPTLADCHYNLARLYDAAGKPQHAIRHLGQYRRLTGGSGS
jgi:DNA-binding transcriptional MerR regulator